MRIPPIFILFCLLFSSIFSFSQKKQFDQLGIRQGLPAMEVYNLYEDKKGYIWSFTEFGIVKHNGSEFIPVCKNLPLNQSAVYIVREDPKGNVFIANSKAKIYSIQNDSAFLVQGMEDISQGILERNEVMYDMIIDDSSNIYFSTLLSSYFYSSRTKKAVKRPGYYHGNQKGIAFRKIGNSFFLEKSAEGMNEVIDILDGNKRNLSLKVSTYPVERNEIRYANGNYYILSTHQLIRVNEKGEMKTLWFDGNTIVLEISPSGSVWVGAMTGLYEIDPELNILNHYLNSFIAGDILFDASGGMWVSTVGQGVFYCSNTDQSSFTDIPELSGQIGLLKVINDQLFVGTSGGKLFALKDKVFEKIDMGDQTFSMTDVIFNEDNYYVGSKNEAFILDKELHFQERLRTLDNKPIGVYAYAKGDKDTLLFISSTAIGKYVKGIQNAYVEKVDKKPRSIVRLNTTDFLIGAMNGMFLYNGKLSQPSYMDIFKNVFVSKMVNDGKGNIWICTRGQGVYILKPDKSIVQCGSLPSHVINDIHFYQDSIVLLSSNTGLFSGLKDKNNHIRSWKLLLNNEISSAVVYKNGIYAATNQGLFLINRISTPTNTNIRFHLESVFSKDQQADTSSLQFAYWQNELSFNFDILDYTGRKQSLYYFLKGPYSNSGIITKGRLDLQNLSPGQYSLQVYHAGMNEWDRTSIEIPFFIEPAFWQTKSFIIEMSIVLLVLVGLCLRMIYKRIKKRAEKRSMIIQLLVEYRLTALKAQINPHFISNSLSAIQQLIINNEIDQANQYIAKFSLLIRHTLQYSDKFVIDLDSEIRIIDLNVDMEQLRFHNRFVYEKQISDEVSTSGIYIPPMITQPFIENAIWHGLLPLKEREPKLVLKIEMDERDLVISIIDNGAGRKEKQEHTGNDPNRESKGTSLIRNRVENLNQMYSTSGILINFIDLKNENGSACGTQVDIVFPLIILNKLYDEKDKHTDHR